MERNDRKTLGENEYRVKRIDTAVENENQPLAVLHEYPRKIPVDPEKVERGVFAEGDVVRLVNGDQLEKVR